MLGINIFICVMLIFMSVEDIKELKIRNIYLLILGAGCGIGCFCRWKQGTFFLDQTIIGISAGLFMLGISMLSKEQIGKGDGLAVTVLGMLYGEGIWFILTLAISGLFLISLYLCIVKKKDKSCKLPFLPGITFGYCIYFILSIIQNLQGVMI